MLMLTGIASGLFGRSSRCVWVSTAAIAGPGLLIFAQRWGFPTKQSPAYKNPVLIARVKELWERNVTQKDMLDMLQVEGFEINTHDLVRVRSKFGWYMRDNTTRKRQGDGSAPQKKKKTKNVVRPSRKNLIDQLAAAILADESEDEESDEDSGEEEERENGESPPRPGQTMTPPTDPLDPAEVLRRQLRQQQLQAESDEKWRARKRRRRTRSWAGLPADAPGEPPRFPSETTLDESKAYLGLENKLYAQIRDEFQAICRSESILKKTVAGPEKWAELLQRLICENEHLTRVFQDQAEFLRQVDALWKPKDYKTLSLDVICQDVTKRMRHLESRMTLAEAKNALDLNPAQTRDVKQAFFQILKEDRFTSKFDAGGEHWNELKQRWVAGSDLLKTALASLDGGEAKRALRLRALEVLARDVMKRLRAESTRLEKEQAGGTTRATHRGPGPGPAPPSAPAQIQSRITPSSPAGTINTQTGNTNVQPSGTHTQHTASPPIALDPALLLAASSAILPLQGPTPTPYPEPFSTHTYPPANNLPFPIYFRLHPHSLVSLPHKTVWLSILTTPTLAEVRRLAAREHPGSEAVVLEGVIGTGAGGEEARIEIDDDAELGAYLEHVRAMAGSNGGGRGKAVFVVRLGYSANGD